MAPLTVLALDRNRFALAGIAGLLATADSGLALAASCANIDEGPELVQRHRPDAVVLGLDDPRRDVATLSRLAIHQSVPVLVLLARRDDGAVDDLLAAGARGLVRHDDEPSVLFRAVRAVCAGDYWFDRATLGRLVNRLTRDPVERPGASRMATLTPRERIVVAAALSEAGASTRCLALRLGVSEHTLRNHLSKIYCKLQVANRVELYAFAHASGTLEQA